VLARGIPSSPQRKESAFSAIVEASAPELAQFLHRRSSVPAPAPRMMTATDGLGPIQNGWRNDQFLEEARELAPE
jgi:hypothetical protein